MKKGIATFTLDHGKCPAWLFERMVKLGREIIQILVAEYGPDEFIERIGDPVWFQSLGTVLAFDWNASGLTTILTAALKEAIRQQERELGIFICGGKGKTSLKTPDQINQWAHRLSLPDSHARNLIYNSKMSAKVDSSLVQDGFDLYHHCFFFSRTGAWTVVQQGMNKALRTARRYHWHSKNIKDLIEEPHSGIISTTTAPRAINMTAKLSAQNRETSIQLINSGYNSLIKDLQILRKHSSSLSSMIKFQADENQLTLLQLNDIEYRTHPVVTENFAKSKYLERILWLICDRKPKKYEDLVAMQGVGPKTIRALGLVSEVIYGAPICYKDPARYSFAHGGKDGIPYPIDRKTYDHSIEILKKAVSRARISPTEKHNALNRLDQR